MSEAVQLDITDVLTDCCRRPEPFPYMVDSCPCCNAHHGLLTFESPQGGGMAHTLCPATGLRMSMLQVMFGYLDTRGREVMP